jgi:hypothetical protein
MSLPDFFFYSPQQAEVVEGTPTDLITITSSLADGTGALHQLSSGIRFLSTAGTKCRARFDVSSEGYTEGWVSFCAYGASGSPVDGSPFFFLSGPTSDLLRGVRDGTGGNWKFQYWNGSAWTDIGATITTASLNSGIFRVDIHFILDNSAGEFSLYINGSLERQRVGEDTIFTADTTVDYISFAATNAGVNNYTNFVGIVVDSVDTRTLYIEEDITVSNGGSTAWAGVENDIDQVVNSIGGDATPIVASAAGQDETYTFAPITSAFDANSIEGVILAIRARAATNPGFYVRGIVRSGGTNYEGDNSVQPLAGNFSMYDLRFENNPITAAPWANTDAVEAVEWGVRSKSTP